MLILTRKIGERILIGKDGEIRLKVLGIRGGQVRLGIEAPKDIIVHREEIFHRIQNEIDHQQQSDTGINKQDLDDNN